MDISRRLHTVARAVTPGNRVADVGTDHGYVPIYLVRNALSPSVIAADINKGPLEKAREHIRAEGLSGKIAVRLGDGLAPLAPEETDTVILAGMGGDLMCRILEDGISFLQAGRELVLQPQSEWFKVRYFLEAHDYAIVREWFLKEEGKYYVVLKAQPLAASDEKSARSMTEAEAQYGRYLIEEKNPVLISYLERELEKRQQILEGLQDSFVNPAQTAGKKAEENAKKREQRCGELMKEIALCAEVLEKMR